jgi:formylmethanofuran dehydrogenase subunit E
MHLDDTLENYVRKVADFHGCFAKAPGVIIGCYMVEYAMELIGEPKGKLHAVAETRVCLTDCIQVMTGCTLGNKYLRLRDELGRYAFSLYSRDTGNGVRVYLDVAKIDRDSCPELYRFHTRTRDPKVLTDMTIRKESGLKVVEEFKRVGRGVLSYQWVHVDLPRKLPLYPSIVCRDCGEPFLRKPGEPDRCGVCRGDPYYQVLGSLPGDSGPPPEESCS